MSTCLVCAVVNVYVPNAGEGLKRLEYRVSAWDTSFSAHLAKLGERKPVILAGDLNCAPQPIDIHNPKRSAFCDRGLRLDPRKEVLERTHPHLDQNPGFRSSRRLS